MLIPCPKFNPKPKFLSEENTSLIFNQTEVFEYQRESHPWITGKIIVLENFRK